MRLELLEEMDLLRTLEARVQCLEKRVKFCIYFINFLKYDPSFEGKFIFPPKRF